jgi:hypothetical protein
VTAELFQGGGIGLYLIDSPDFHGLSSPPRWGHFLSQPAGDLLWRPQFALEPALRPVGFKGIDAVTLGALKPAQPVAVTRHG